MFKALHASNHVENAVVPAQVSHPHENVAARLSHQHENSPMPMQDSHQDVWAVFENIWLKCTQVRWETNFGHFMVIPLASKNNLNPDYIYTIWITGPLALCCHFPAGVCLRFYTLTLTAGSWIGHKVVSLHRRMPWTKLWPNCFPYPPWSCSWSKRSTGILVYFNQ